MGFIKFEKRKHVDRLKRSHSSEWTIATCDLCEKEYSQRRRTRHKSEESCGNSLFFCCKEHQNQAKRSGGKLSEKYKSAVKEKYNVANIFQLREVKEKISKIQEIRYGGQGFKSEKISSKIRATMKERYGFENAMHVDSIVDSVDWKMAAKKQHKTKKKNGTYRQSKIELKFGKFLKEHFDIVKSQALTNGWLIDFYVPEINTYIQFDGVYWHGLDRPIKQIRESKSSRDKQILKGVARDKKQNKWFKANKLRLIRITDQEFSKEDFSSIIKKIKS